MEQVLAQPNINDPLGLRDRALMETLYSTGMRRMELANLKLYDLDTERGTVTIRQGKGKKDRVIPIGDRAAAWMDKYLRESRPQLVVEPDDHTVFLSNAGEPFCLDHLSDLVRTYVDAANIGKRGACHGRNRMKQVAAGCRLPPDSLPPFTLGWAIAKNGKQTDLLFPLAATMAASG